MTSLNNPVKLPLDANGNVLANLNAQNITPNAKATNITLDANGNVLANLNAQNITPNAKATNITLDANGNVLANVNSQNINPNINNILGSSSTLISHQTGLSITSTTAGTFYNIGSVIDITKTGIIRISVIGHVEAGTGFIQIGLTRNSVTYYLGTYSASLFSENSASAYFYQTSPTLLLKNTSGSDESTLSQAVDEGDFVLSLLLYAGDTIQFLASNGTAGYVTYIDNLMVVEQ